MTSAPPLPARAVLLLAALCLLVFTKDRPDSWADGSRMGTIQGLVEHGSLALDDTDYFWQGDKLLLGGRFYSHQPPMLAILGAAPYAVLHHGLGRAIDDPWTYRVVTWFCVGLPVWLGLLALSRLLADSGAPPGWQAVWLALAYFGTLLLPYSLVLNQHGAAAGLVLVALWACARDRVALAGLVLALATTIDLTAVFAAVACAWPVLARGGPGAILRYGLAALPVLGLHFGVNQAIAGDLVPFGLHLEGFDYPLSPFLFMSLTGGESGGGSLELLEYSKRALFLESGLFSHHPILLVAAGAAVGLLVRRRRDPDSGLPASLLGAVAAFSLAIAAYYLTQSRNFGGSSFGMRWFTVFSPALVLFPVAWIARGDEPTPWGRWLLAPVALWSIAAAGLGAVEPWAKFAYTPAHRSDALIADEETLRTPLREHWSQQWERIRTWHQPFDRDSYVATQHEQIVRLGMLHTKRFPGVSDEEYRTWVTRGIEVLIPYVDHLDKDVKLAPELVLQGHFWLGNMHRKLERWAEARRHYNQARQIDAQYLPLLRAIEKLNAESDAPPQF